MAASQRDRRLLELHYDNMLACIRCGLCSSVCPTYQQTLIEEQSPRGRIAIARALAEGHLAVTPDLLHAMDSCLLCEACTAICPSGVHMEGIGEAVRTLVTQEQARPASWRERLVRWVGFRLLLNDLARLRTFAWLNRVYQRSGLRTLVRRTGVLRLLGLERAEAFLPDLPQEFFVPRGQTWQPAAGPARRRVAVVAGCVMSTAFADTDRATVEVLTANGCEVVAPAGQACCGAIHAHSGELPLAQELARQNIRAFQDLDLDAIVVNAAGCGSMLKGYGRLLADDPEYAQAAAEFSAKVKDITEFLDGLPLVPPGKLEVTVTFQEPCHLAHAQGIKQAPRRLLRAVPGLTLVEMAESDRCCGSAGIYNLTQPAMSDELLQRKVRHILATGADFVVTANPGCQMQVQAGLRAAGSSARVIHIVDLLAQAYQNGR
ncbi:MAG: (Fe-S)-binding protein [Chloroflexi bacterium]|nr:(Fe-S)-binding protein [Chloroflexota bacterium]